MKSLAFDETNATGIVILIASFGSAYGDIIFGSVLTIIKPKPPAPWANFALSNIWHLPRSIATTACLIGACNPRHASKGVETVNTNGVSGKTEPPNDAI